MKYLSTAHIHAQNQRVLRLSLYSALLDHYLDFNMVEAFHRVSEKMKNIINEIEDNARTGL